MRDAFLNRSRPGARLHRIVFAIGWVAAVSLTHAPNALAEASHGRGWWGEVNDKVVTDFGFIMIGGFPLIILIFSLIQWRLEKRKDARKAAEKALLANVTWHGGW
jgi:hypothetical protein